MDWSKMAKSWHPRRAIPLWRRGWRRSGSKSSDPNVGDTRTIHCNDRALNVGYGYDTNVTSSTKYTWYNFLAFALFVQYRRAAYWYFTAMAVLSLTPFSPYSPVSVVLPLIFVLALGLGREFWEDLRRSRGDKVVNSRPTQVFLNDGKTEVLPWRDLQVGDLVRVTDGEYFPADLLILSSSGPDGVCYVETKNLDGETNLKVRQALESTWYLDEASLSEFKADVKCEGPNPSLYTFSGTLKLQQGQSLPLGPLQLLLRDSSLQNTGHIWGAVIYTGHDTKVMKNATAPPSKRSRMDRSLDMVIYAMFAILLVMSVISGVILGVRTKNSGSDLWYLVPFVSNPYFNPNRAAVAGIVSAVNALVLYGYLIPIALYVTLEIVRVIQGLFMMQDLAMYDAQNDKAAKVRSTGLNEELGQVDTILSDKTGTLTCNQMDFFRCSIAGVSYGRGTTEVERAAQRLGVAAPITVPRGGGGPGGAQPEEESGPDEEGEELGSEKHNPYREKGFNFHDSRVLGGNWTREENRETLMLFFQVLALCHTAIPEGKVDEPKTMRYRAESPDEEALVVAAKQFGFCFFKRTPSTMLVREAKGAPGSGEHADVTYELLNVLEFSSARKRMSVIVRFPDGRLMLLAKGADSVMAPRVVPARGADAGNGNGPPRFVTPTLHHLHQYAEVGLRTLVVAYRELDEAEYQTWHAKFAEARTVIGREREQRIEDVEEEIERKLLVVGGTGVEDKLQLGVPETIDHLAQAGINIWVLTGDKVETAINIGYACSLLRKGMQKIIISLEGAEAREVEERAEKENLSKDEVNQELKGIVAQQLAEGTSEIGKPGGAEEPEETVLGSSVRDLASRSGLGRLSRSFSESILRSRSQGSSSQRESGEEMHEYRTEAADGGGGSAVRKHENGEASLLTDGVAKGSRRGDRRTPSLGGGVSGSRKLSRRGSLPSMAGEAEASYALVIDGQSLALILADERLQEEFIGVCKECASVLCCRVSPMQKAQVTKLVRKGMGENRLCLAIGDGANDVGMIQAANVGVGITGVEGAQAAMSADYAFGQFRFLERLLLVHGHWCYRRIALMILYFFYKVSLIGWIAFCCNVYAYFSGQPLYNDWYASFYNTIFTAFPVGAVGCIDQDVSAKEAIKNPQLYRAGHRKELFNRPLMTMWLLNSVYTGLVIFFFPFALYRTGAYRSGGETASVQEFGVLLFSCLVLVPNVQLAIAIGYFTWIHHVLIWGSMALWYVFLLIYGALPVQYATTAYAELTEAVGSSPSYWLLQLLVVVVAIMPDFVFRCTQLTLFPHDYQRVMAIEAQSKKEDDHANALARESGVS